MSILPTRPAACQVVSVPG